MCKSIDCEYCDVVRLGGWKCLREWRWMIGVVGNAVRRRHQKNESDWGCRCSVAG